MTSAKKLMGENSCWEDENKIRVRYLVYLTALLLFYSPLPFLAVEIIDIAVTEKEMPLKVTMTS